MNISCASSGIPVPTISWTINNHPAPFNETSQVTDFIFSTSTAKITEGNVVSTLHIANIQYPAHHGVYVCTGSNHHAVMRTAMLTLQVLGEYLFYKRSLDLYVFFLA